METFLQKHFVRPKAHRVVGEGRKQLLQRLDKQTKDIEEKVPLLAKRNAARHFAREFGYHSATQQMHAYEHAPIHPRLQGERILFMRHNQPHH